ncbi:MAG: hypothetical protein GZ086_06015, partial [Gelidibacter sp.]|nr:hypothetical protein [Gelidibacter sp.]
MESKITYLKDFFNNFIQKFDTKRNTTFFKVFLTLCLTFVFSTGVWGQTTVTPGSGGTAINPQWAFGGTSAQFATLGSIVITEGDKADFSNMVKNNNSTIVLSPPSGWNFQSSTGNISHSSGGDLTTSSIAVTSTTITITVLSDKTNTANAFDVLTISGIKVQATSTTSGIVNIIRSGGTLSINGVTNGVTNFGSLSLAAKLASTISVNVAGPYTYSGSSQGPSTSTVTGSTGAVIYSYYGVSPTTYSASTTKPTDAGSYEVIATLASDDNYNGAVSAPLSFTIGKAASVTTVTIAAGTFTYTGSAITPASV